MRGQDSRSGSLFSYVDLEQRVRSDHPLRGARTAESPTLTLFAVHPPKTTRNEAEGLNVDPFSAAC